MIDARAPFVLFDDARRGSEVGARLYAHPVEIVRADAIEEVEGALDRIAAAAARGLHAAGFLTYEAGFALEPRLRTLAGNAVSDLPLVWFGLFEQVEEIAADALSGYLPDPAGAAAGAPVAQSSRHDFEATVGEAQRLIAAGEIYQANLSFDNKVRIAGAPLALYAGLRRAEAGWGGVVFTGDHWLLSASPEMFFTLDGDRLTARPMKGTSRRGVDAEDDSARIAELAADPKQRAENLMIVDLIRNDLSRVSTPGSVAVPRLFEVETYPTVHQLTSTVDASLAPGLGPVDVVRAMFPCGSITGAPKIRAMEAIASLEKRVRGAYTGSMGWIAPNGRAAFNVLIRTLSMRAGAGEASLGLGAGIVADSRPDEEWRECLAKGAFVTAGQRRFDLVETMRFDPQEGLVDLDLHLARLGRSAVELGFAFDRHGARNELQAATFALRDGRMVRLRLARGGHVAIEIRTLPGAPGTPVEVALRALPVDSTDFRLRHKTSDRGFYDDARARCGRFETLFVRPDGFLTEGSFTNLFVERDGAYVTPPLERGLLPGVLRESLIAQGRAREADLTHSDLEGGFWVGNAVRGLIAARLESQPAFTAERA